MKPTMVIVALLVVAAVIFGLANASVGQPKPDSGSEDRLARIEKRLEQIDKRLEQLEKTAPGRWQMQTLQQESVTSTAQPVRYAPNSTAYLLDTQTGTLVRFNSATGEVSQLHPKK
jgi:hypothetical protein